MAVLPIRVVPDRVLREKAKRIRRIDDSIRKLAADMLETMHSALGVGLAANQVGVLLRLIVIQIPEQDPLVLVNPKIVKRSGERIIPEGCLSIPGYRGEVKRSERVLARALDLDGKEVRIKADELLAQAIEHEIDHLDGILYTDRLESLDKLVKVEPEEEKPEAVEI
ncbi:MAG: peptide deformylase [Chloroflexi bacterium]|nr:peptide deformylase [Chloroflexota bacterium]